MRGENNRYTAATIIDGEGNTKYYIVPDKMIMLVVAFVGLLILGTIVLSAIVFYNTKDINQLRDRIVIEEHTPDEGHTQNTNGR